MMHDTQTQAAGSPDNVQPEANSPTSERTEDGVVIVSKSAAVQPDEKPIVGMVCDKKDLYQKWDAHKQYTWTDKYPEDLEQAAENEETQRFAVLVRNKKSSDSRKALEIDSIIVQSPLLKRVLAGVLADYPGVTTQLQRLVFSAPFQPFVHRWPQLVAALEDAALDAPTRAHLQLLHDLLAAELGDVIAALADYAANRVVAYQHVWAVLPPGCVVLASRFGTLSASRAVQGQYISHARLGPCFELACERIGFDGTKFGLEAHHQFVLPYLGTVPVADLDVYPLAYHPQPDAVHAVLEARGRKFERLAGVHYRAYVGSAIETTENGPRRTLVDGRIMVDARTHATYNPEYGALAPLAQLAARRKVQGDDEDDAFEVEPGHCDTLYEDVFDPTQGELRFRAQTGAAGRGGDDDDDDDGKSGRLALTPAQLLLCTPMVKGFELRSKKWLEFYVDDVADVTFNEQAFERLVLPDGHKQLILAFAQSQISHRHRFDDVIAGKGRGIVMLLSGGPGIGKTLTAESVAEVMRVPLFVLTATDMGTHAYEVEAALDRAFTMVAKWNAVLLIDECDVVLEARNANDLERNRIVSVFLRTLEYYEGILFLTTNRVDNIDPAFHSRIHINLHYPELDGPARRSIWDGFLGPASSSSSLPAAELDRLAALPLNGRQIKNVVKTASLLAFQRGQPLAHDHIHAVLSIQGLNVDA